jgi:hypothetical protein
MGAGTLPAGPIASSDATRGNRMPVEILEVLVVILAEILVDDYERRHYVAADTGAQTIPALSTERLQ